MASPPYFDLEVEPGRGDCHVPGLCARGYRLQPIAASHLHLRRDRPAARAPERALVTEPGWGADRAHVDLDVVLTRVPSMPVVFMPDTFPRPGPNASVPNADPDSIAYLAFTSGTTGAPKCVMYSHNTLLANA